MREVLRSGTLAGLKIGTIVLIDGYWGVAGRIEPNYRRQRLVDYWDQPKKWVALDERCKWLEVTHGKAIQL